MSMKSNAFSGSSNPDLRMDVVKQDLSRVDTANLAEATDQAGLDSSADVKDADGVNEAYRPFQANETIKSAAPSTAKSVVKNDPASAWPGRKAS